MRFGNSKSCLRTEKSIELFLKKEEYFLQQKKNKIDYENKKRDKELRDWSNKRFSNSKRSQRTEKSIEMFLKKEEYFI